MSSKLAVIVTGGFGFIGSELVRQLLSKDFIKKVVVIDNNVKNEHTLESIEKQFLPNKKDKDLVWYNKDLSKGTIVDELATIIQDEKIDIVYGLAALIGGIKYFHDHPAEILRDNDAITTNTLEGIRLTRKRIKPLFVYISSSMIYEANEDFPTSECDIRYIPLSAYGFSKLVGHALCEAYYDQYRVNYVICSPFNAYGCLEFPKEVGIAHVVPDLIKKVLDGQGLSPDNPLQILGDGNQIRCYTHVSDIVDGIITASIKTDRWFTTYNISSPKPHSVNEVAQLIWNRIHGNKPLYRKYLPALTYDVQKRIPDVNKAREYLGWTAKYVLEDKIDEVIDWVKSVI